MLYSKKKKSVNLVSCILKELKHFTCKIFCNQSLWYWDGELNMF